MTATTTTFVVDTLTDSPLGTSGDTSCADAETTPMCSLRAAIEAANNLAAPVEIVLPAGTYNLDAATYGDLAIHNRGGTSIVGADDETTTINVSAGNASVLMVDRDVDGHGSTLWLTGVTLSGGNSAAGGGLEIVYGNDSAVLDDVTVSFNSALTGAGIACGTSGNGGNLWITDSTITLNSAVSYGGGIYAYQCGLVIKDSHIDMNWATGGVTGGYGGGLAIEYGTAQIHRSTFNENTAGEVESNGFGAGIYNYYAVINGKKVTIDKNMALDGNGSGYAAGVDVYGGVLELYKSSISDNTAYGSSSYGAGVYIEEYGGQVALHNTHVDRNVTEWDGSSGECYYGGAIYIYPGDGYATALTLDNGSTLNNNTGGGLSIYAYYGGTKINITDSEINWNVAPGDYGGGAVCAYVDDYGSIGIRLKRTDVRHNSATGYYSAGGIMATMDEDGGIDVHIKGGTIANNEAGYEGTGGIAVIGYDYGGAQLEVENATIADNVAGEDGYGGGIFAYDDDEYATVGVTLKNVLITGNQVGTVDGGYGTGGGIAVEGYATLEVRDSKIKGNTAIGTESNPSYGGGVYLDTESTSSFTKTKINANTAVLGYGGGVYTDGYTDRFGRSTIANNQALAGGGIYADSEAYTLLINRSTISGNTAGDETHDGQGGGVYLDYAGGQLLNSTVANNTALGQGSQGGGIYVRSNYSLTIDFSTIAGNVAQEGSGFYGGSTGLDQGSAIRGSIIADGCDSESPPGTTLASAGHNVVTDEECLDTLTFGDQLVANAGLKPLAKYGGPTKTMKLKKSSPAIKGGGKNCPPKDQRGVHRPNRCDSGAYER